jgi:hypothetical protein
MQAETGPGRRAAWLAMQSARHDDAPVAHVELEFTVLPVGKCRHEYERGGAQQHHRCVLSVLAYRGCRRSRSAAAAALPRAGRARAARAAHGDACDAWRGLLLHAGCAWLPSDLCRKADALFQGYSTKSF